MKYIGIDPDSDKSGVAVYDTDEGKIRLFNLKFFDLFDYLNENKGNIAEICVEAGWMNRKSNWHGAKNVSTASKVGKNVGSNHQTGRLLCEMIEYLRIPYCKIVPHSAKWDNDFVQRYYHGSTNSEQRDALKMLLYIVPNKFNTELTK